MPATTTGRPERLMSRTTRIAVLLVITACSLVAAQQGQEPKPKWVASWAASLHGPYPSGNPAAQPVLDFAFESPERGAIDQTFRLIIKPDLWGRVVRLRFANTFGTPAVTFDDVFVGCRARRGNVVPGTNRPRDLRRWQEKR